MVNIGQRLEIDDLTRAMNLLTFKLLAAVAIITVASIGGVIPIMARRMSNSRRFFSLAGGFASGVFLGAGLIHLLPDGLEKLRPVSGYPIGGLLATVGLALLLLLDRVVFPHARERRHGGPGASPYVLTMVLSVHSVIAGVTLGLETQITTAVAILLAILFHKGSEAFALIVSLHGSGVSSERQKSVLRLFVFMTPLGLLIGTLASAQLSGASATIAEGAFEALAAGTFIYVAVLDIIGDEMSFDEDKGAEFALVATGIAFMALLASWT